MTRLLRTAGPAVRRLWTAAVALCTVLVCLAGLPATHASAATSTQLVTGPIFLTNGAWPNHILCASADNDSVWLKSFDTADPYCQWIRVGDRNQFLLFNPEKQKIATYLGGNGGAVVMQDLALPTPTQQYFSWGGAEDWGAYALQSFWDTGQNVDAMAPDGDSPRTDAVHTRGWRHGYQQELTWNELPVADANMERGVAALTAYQNYLNSALGSGAPDETACMTEDIAFGSPSAGKDVSAELGYTGDAYGELRARADAIGPWEQFTLCRNNRNGLYSLRSSANGKYVSAELGYTGDNYGELRARADAIGPWEQFTLEPSGAGYAIKSNANGKYVSAELGYTGDNYGELRARADAIGPWEQFQSTAASAQPRPIYAFAHNLNSAERVNDALDAGYNGIEVDAAFNVSGGCAGGWQWVACDPGNPSSDPVNAGNIGLKLTGAIFDAMANARRSGKNLAVAWVDIKDSNDGDQPAQISALRGMVRDKLLAAGIRVMYEVPYSADNSAAWNALKQNLSPLESVAVTGTYSQVSGTYSAQGGGIPAEHRFATDGSAVFATLYGTCMANDDKVTGLKESVANRDAGNLRGVFAWTMGSSPDGADCAARMLGEVGVNGLIAGSRLSDYIKESDTDLAVKNVTDWVHQHPDQTRMANTHDNLFG
ncbi:hypothetical protein [Streptacidiphilus rugosus]|uniref:hypothetical protein n=1 Tax=Streptacidiphilus rugosus TaxID=405783 RepID=UPI00056C6CB5|nr:hypothetical protein [Streptacidiphilus rugosus]